jgi:predicted nucleic acid-binding protein
VLDTGPLIAFLSADDSHHSWAAETFAAIRSPAKSCEAVVSEACFLLGRNRKRASAVLDLVASAGIEIVSMAEENSALVMLMNKYASVPMSYADACLVRLSELHPDSVVVTTDSDFKVYRRQGRKVIRTLAPPD